MYCMTRQDDADWRKEIVHGRRRQITRHAGYVHRENTQSAQYMEWMASEGSKASEWTELGGTEGEGDVAHILNIHWRQQEVEEAGHNLNGLRTYRVLSLKVLRKREIRGSCQLGSQIIEQGETIVRRHLQMGTDIGSHLVVLGSHGSYRQVICYPQFYGRPPSFQFVIKIH